MVLAEVRNPGSADLARVAAAIRLNVSREHGVTPSIIRLMKPRTVPKVRLRLLEACDSSRDTPAWS